MAVYLILMALVLVLAYPLIEHKPNVVKKLCYVIVTFGAMYLISVFRYGLGNDYYSYIYISGISRMHPDFRYSTTGMNLALQSSQS